MCIGDIMKLGLSSLPFVNASIEEAIRASAKLGVECVEIVYDVPHFPPDYDHRKLSGIKELLDTHGLQASVHASFWDLNPASHYRKLWELTLEQTRRSIDACRAFDGEIVVVHFGRCPIPNAIRFLEGTKRRYREFINKCIPYAEERGVTLTLENAAGQPIFYPSNVEELRKFVAGLGGVKITFDIGHAHLAERRAGRKGTGAAIARSIEALREHLVHVHVHDNYGMEDDHLPPGDGDIDFKPAADTLRAINYDGLLIAELWKPKHPLEAARKGIKKTRDIFG